MTAYEKDAEGAPAPAEELSELPELTDERIDELEAALFAAVAHERQESVERERHLAADRERRAAASRRKKRRGWFIGAGAAAAVVVVLALAPSLARLGGAGGTTADGSAVAPGAPDSLPDKDLSGGGAPGVAPGEGAPADGGGDQSTGDRDIIATASATVRVEDVAASATAVGAAAQKRGGYVESMNVGQSGAVRDETYDPTYPAPPGGSGAWITVRVPADQLTAAIDDLSAIGRVEASSIARQDVTTQSVDLRARVDALQASVDRLTELMAKTGSVADLIAAESALSQRQADLESLQQQLKALDDQVSMSTLTVSLVPRIEAVEANPAGFGDGLATGWNGLVATLNGLVIALGFLLPWLAVAAVVAAIVWLIVRLARRRRPPTGDTPSA